MLTCHNMRRQVGGDDRASANLSAVADHNGAQHTAGADSSEKERAESELKCKLELRTLRCWWMRPCLAPDACSKEHAVADDRMAGSFASAAACMVGHESVWNGVRE